MNRQLEFFYQYRWWLVIMANAMLAGFAYLSDLEPLYRHYGALRQEERQLNNAIVGLQVKLAQRKQMPATLPESAFQKVDHMTSTAMSAGLVLQRVTVHQSLFYAEFQGDFKRFANFIFRMSQLSPSSSVGDLSYQVGEKVEVEMMPGSQANKVSEDAGGELNNPFCNEADRLLNQRGGIEQAHSYSLTQMRMLGYVRQGVERLALVQLPNGALIEVRPDRMLGKEHGIVSEISSKKMIISLPNQQRISLSMS